MNKEVISAKQGVALLVIFILGTSQIYAGGGRAKQDLWISIIIALIVSIPTILIFGKLMIMHPGKSLFQILNTVFGKAIGNIITLLYTLNFFLIGGLCIRDVTEFIQTASLSETPQYFSAIWIILLAIYMVKSGIEVFARWTDFILLILLIVIVSLMIIAIPKLNLENILPILYDGWKPVFHSALSYYSFPFAEVIVFLTLFNNLDEHKNIYSIFLKGLIIGGLILLVTSVKNMALLGFPNLTQIYYPSYYANSLISLGTFLQRLEVSSAVMMFLTGFAKLCVYLFAVCIGLSHLFKYPKYSDLAFPIGFSMLVLSLILFKNTMEMIEFMNVSMYYLLLFQFFIPVVTLVVAGIKRQLTTNN